MSCRVVKHKNKSQRPGPPPWYTHTSELTHTQIHSNPPLSYTPAHTDINTGTHAHTNTHSLFPLSTSLSPLPHPLQLHTRTQTHTHKQHVSRRCDANSCSCITFTRLQGGRGRRCHQATAVTHVRSGGNLFWQNQVQNITINKPGGDGKVCVVAAPSRTQHKPREIGDRR